ncbi:MAG: hypothetical protein KatS3mg118_0760 [Paracoccaceae bacterium]|nr:MAG: hypothetical protein KatS3mg118_0760 [Paracoccaceae bacterium]
MLGRLPGAVLRAGLVLLLCLLPAAMLPDTTRNALQASLIAGGLVAAFVLHEYAARQPLLIDFRFAPPYNRARAVTLAALLIALTLLVRAGADGGAAASALAARADRLAALMDGTPGPVAMAGRLAEGWGMAGIAPLMRRAVALALTIAAAAVLVFGLVLWVFRWPARRERFNLWANLPTFQPVEGRLAERRLRLQGGLYLLAGLTLPFWTAILAERAGGLVAPVILASFRTLVWTVAIWAFLAASFCLRGLAMIKIAWLVRRARGAG